MESHCTTQLFLPWYSYSARWATSTEFVLQIPYGQVLDPFDSMRAATAWLYGAVGEPGLPGPLGVLVLLGISALATGVLLQRIRAFEVA